MSGMMTGVLLDGTKVGNKSMTLPQASFHFKVWILVPPVVRRIDWVKMNLGTGAAVNTFPLNFGPEGAGDGRFYRTASGELLRSLNGRLTGVLVQCCRDRVQRTTRFLPWT